MSNPGDGDQFLNFEPRFYRDWCKDPGLVSFKAVVAETDLFIKAEKDLSKEAIKSISESRKAIEDYFRVDPAFKGSMNPLSLPKNAPDIIKDMIIATAKVGVGPMAGVAGAIAEYVGNDLLKFSKEVMIENGGDIFIKTLKKRIVGVYAGKSKFTNRIGIEILPEYTPLGICTSSGTVGHSLSFGTSDAVVVISPSTTLADAAATAIGNIIKEKEDINKGIEFAKKTKGIDGILIIKGDSIGVWGKINLCDL